MHHATWPAYQRHPDRALERRDLVNELHGVTQQRLVLVAVVCVAVSLLLLLLLVVLLVLVLLQAMRSVDALAGCQEPVGRRQQQLNVQHRLRRLTQRLAVHCRAGFRIDGNLSDAGMAHQHGGGAGHAAGGAGAGGPSGMVWNWDTDMTILFPFWQTHGTMSMLASSLGIAVVCFLLEWFKEYRHINDPLWIEQLERTAYSSSVDTDDNASDVELATAQPSWASDQTHHRGGSGASPSKHSPSSSSATVHHRHDQWQSWKLQLIRTSAYMLELGASLIIMSIFMLLNGWISIAIIVGTGSGFFLFRMGLRPKSLVHPSGGGHGGAMASGSASRHTAASTSSC